MTIKFTLLHPRMTQDHLGILPEFFVDSDPRPAKEQLNERYAHGGGYRPIKGFKLSNEGMFIKYPGDERLKPLAKATLHPGTEQEEELYFYESSFLLILQLDGDFTVVRVD